MNFMSRLPWWKKKEINKNVEIPTNQHNKILVISWGWFRWTYALWIMKALEEYNLYSEIDAIYWVSIWAIVWSLWANGMKAEYIFDILSHISITDFYWSDMLRKSGWFVSNRKINALISKYLPKDFESLQKPFYAWCVDTNTAEYQLFNHGDLHKIVLWSMSIPWVFPPVKYDIYSLVDWGVLNNFPVDLAKEQYPKHKVIWIALNKFQMNQKIRSAFDNLLITFEVMMRSKLLANTKLVDFLFYRELPIPVLSLSKNQMRKAFDLWYEDWIKMFKKKD